MCALTSRVFAADSVPSSGTPDLSELSLEALIEIEVPKVYGASKFEQKTTEAPSSISLLSSDEIKRYGYRTLGDVLQSLQGFHVSYDRNYAFLGSRGINLGDFNSRVLLLVNGHRVNNNITDGAFIDSAFILDVDLIDRVEVIRGPGSVLYGNNAFLGVINVITRQGAQLKGTELSGEYGEFDAYKGRVTYGNSFSNGVEFLLSGSMYGTEGKEEIFYPEFKSSRNNGVARNRDDDSFGSFFGSVRYLDFTLEGAYIDRDKENPTAQYFTTFNDPRLRTADKRGYTALKYAHSFPDLFDLTARVYYDRTEFEIGYPQSIAIGSTVTNLFARETDIGEWWGAELQLNKKLWERHIVTLGAEYRDDFRQERQVTGQPIVRQTRQSHGIYAQGDFEVVKQLHLNSGIRYDQYGDFDPGFNPRVALIYNPVPRSTIKAVYGTAFRTPNFLELADSQTAVTPTELQPEEITSYELIYEQELMPHLRGSLAGFYNQMDDLIVLQNGAFANLDATTRGTEVGLEGYWTNAVRARLSYTLQKTENETGDLAFPDSPEHLVKMNVSVPLWRNKVFAGLEYQYTSMRRSLHNTTIPSTVQGADVDGFGVFNLTLYSCELVKNLEFSASVYNLFDREYSDPATRFHVQDALERDGRTYRMKLTYRF